MKTRAGDPTECPNPACHGEVDTGLERNGALYYVMCGTCRMEGPVSEHAETAVIVWNNLARYDEDTITTLPHPDAEDDEDEDTTIATLVRMLDETRTFHEELKDMYNELLESHEKLKTAYQIRKGQNLSMAYGGTTPQSVSDLVAMQAADNMAMPLNQMKDITIVGKNVVPKMEETIKRLKSKQITIDRRAEEQEAKLSAMGKDLKAALTDKHEAHKRIRDWEQSMFLLDIGLVSLELSKQYPDTIEPVTSTQDLLDAIRQKEWPPDNATRTFDDPLGEIIHICSPHGRCPAPGLYLRAIQAQLTTHPTKETMITSVYGLAMERFGQGTPGYTLAWNALGRPGETKLDGRRRRT